MIFNADKAIKPLVLAVNAAILAFATGDLYAQESAPVGTDKATVSSPLPPAQMLQIEEVVITARKTEESQQSVPISVAAFSAKDLQDSVILNVLDLGEHVTGMVVTTNAQGNAPTFAIRATKTDNGVDGGVAVYLDDMPLVSTIGAVNSFYDMSSVEILKGPQGTLFGVNTTGGTVSFRANKPTDKFEGYADMASETSIARNSKA